MPRIKLPFGLDLLWSGEYEDKSPLLEGKARVVPRDGFADVPRLSWHFGRRALGPRCELRLDRDERQVTVALGAPFASTWLTVPLPKVVADRLPWSHRRTDYAYMGGHRTVGGYYHEGTVHLSLWGDAHEWRSGDPKWMSWHVNIPDLVLGKNDYSTRVVEERKVTVPMPEGRYPATAKLELATRKRPRWPVPDVRRRVQIDIPDGIPTPGKGENSYDCGPDATYGISVIADSIEDGVGKLVASVLSTRRSRGGGEDYAKR